MRPLAVLTIALLASLLPAPVPAQPTRPTLTKVTITRPTGTPQQPFRTNRELISIEFTSDAQNGIFFATSVGADVPMSTFLANTSNGKVGAGLLTEGIKNVQVTVSTGGNVPTTQQISVTSAAVVVILDMTPPKLTITQIKLRPQGNFEGYDPNRIYRTNGNQIVLRGFASDGATGVPPDEITISTSGVMTPATTKPDAQGSWEITVDISKEPDGPIDLVLVANDNVGGSARYGNRSEVTVGLR